MATRVENAFGTPDELALASAAIAPGVTVETYDDRAVAALPPEVGTGQQTFADSALSSPGPAGGSLRVDTVGVNSGQNERMGALMPIVGGPVDMSSNPAIRVYVRFNASAYAKLATTAVGNSVVSIYNNLVAGADGFLWRFDKSDIPAADLWVELVFLISNPDVVVGGAADITAITHTEVVWYADPATPTDGTEQMWLDNFVRTGVLDPIYSMTFRPEGGGTGKARTWVVYDDGT